MKICIVHSFYDTSAPSGENVVVDAQVDQLRQAGHEVHLLAAQTPPSDIRSSTYAVRSAIRVASGHGHSPLADIARIKPEIVHVHNLFPNYSDAWLRQCKYPIVATLHNFRPLCAAGTLFRDGQPCQECISSTSVRAVRHRCYRDSALATLPPAMRPSRGASHSQVLQNADVLIVLSERSRKTYLSAGAPSDRMRLVSNFAPPSEFPREGGVGSGRWLYVGRLSAEKGLREALDGWPTGVELAIVGDGPLASIREWASGRPHIQLRGRLPQSQVKQELARARGLLFPSLCQEGAYTMAYLEALSAGLPTIARRGNAVGDHVEQYRTGAVFTHPRELPLALETVEQNMATMMTLCSTIYEHQFSPRAWLASTESLYEELIGK